MTELPCSVPIRLSMCVQSEGRNEPSFRKTSICRVCTWDKSVDPKARGQRKSCERRAYQVKRTNVISLGACDTQRDQGECFPRCKSLSHHQHMPLGCTHLQGRMRTRSAGLKVSMQTAQHSRKSPCGAVVGLDCRSAERRVFVGIFSSAFLAAVHNLLCRKTRTKGRK